MSPRLTWATTRRVLTQLRHDHRTIGLLVGIPSLIVALIAWMFHGTDVLNRSGPMLVGAFPLIVVFVVTSVATLRERQTGTLERLMTTPIGRADFVLGYALAFALLAVLQAVVVVGVALACGMEVAGSLGWVLLLAMLSATLGSSLGLVASAVARTEFQAVQMMPATLFPQLVTAGILMPRDAMPQLLEWISRAFPLTYTVDAMNAVAAGGGWAEIRGATGAIVAFIVGALVIGIVTLPRRTP